MTDTPDFSCLLNHTTAHAPSPPADLRGPAGTIAPNQETAPPAEAPPVFHTVEAVARTLGVSAKTIARRIREGVIRKAPMGGRLVRISAAELQRLAGGGASDPGIRDGEVSMP